VEPWSREPVGRFDELEIKSAVLRDNPLAIRYLAERLQ